MCKGYSEIKMLFTKYANVEEMTEAELNMELERGYVDMFAGRTKPAKQVLDDIRKDYGI